MSDVKTAVRIIIALMCFYGAVNGQILNRRQMILQRQQKQLDQQQDILESQFLTQVWSLQSFSVHSQLILQFYNSGESCARHQTNLADKSRSPGQHFQRKPFA